MTRLLNFFEPELAQDFTAIDHSLYLIKWFMTLFAHTLPLNMLTELIWVDLFCEEVGYLFFLAVAILTHLKDRILLQKRYERVLTEEEDGMHALGIVQILSGSLSSVLNKDSDVIKILKEARQMSSLIPTSLSPIKNTKEEAEIMPPSTRWWVAEKLYMKPEIVLPLISVQDAIEIKKNKIIIDVRPFTAAHYGVFGIEATEENKHANFLDCHVKNSYFMADTVTLSQLTIKTGLSPNQAQAFERDMERLESVCKIQVEFLLAYRENYPANLIVVVGNKFNYGADFARFLASRFVSKVCILEGGIDAFKAHSQGKQMLRKGKPG